MKKLILTGLVALAGFAQADWHADMAAMSPAYWKIWTPEVTAKLKADIEKFRKADFSGAVGAPAGAEVKVEQISHAFFFGAHIFNYNQLGKTEWNNRYKELYGTLFNSATVAFYWKTLEPYQGQVRFQEDYRDTEAFWNTCAHPKDQPHWRRPAIDPVINFLRSRDLRIHGHPLCWGNNAWQTPTWIWDEFCPQAEKEALEAASGVKLPAHDWRQPMGAKEFGRDEGWRQGVVSWAACWKRIFEVLSEEEVACLCPTYFAKLNEFTFGRVERIARAYGTRVQSWDVCNESSPDFHGQSVTGRPFQKSPRYGVTAGDLCYNAFRTAQANLPKSAWLNINDYAMDENYFAQIKDLEKNGVRIDVIGSQMHLFNPAESVNIARGEGPAHLRPEGIAARFALLSRAGKPIHLSEITITAPDASARGQMVQAIILRNLYRAWFAVEKMNGITWWNVVDDCGAPGEPSISGLFTRDMRPKTAYYAMDDLINNEWKTRTTVKVSPEGAVAFRGFRGRYRLSWTDKDGKARTRIVEVK
ncbi:MAG: endo-1,4-beta-xylanase [Kiritimatiellia bacterium]